MPLYSGIWTLSQASQAAKNNTWTGIAPPTVEYLIVAGGGGGGSANTGNSGGGGGAGGLLQGHASITPGSLYYVTIGAAGNGSTPGGTGTNGGNSVFDSTSSGAATGRIVANGGGYGANGYNGTIVANSGGSGGGGGASAGSNVYGALGISGQGNAGGYGNNTIGYNAGGGGGAGTVGLNCVASSGGAGGAGIASDISGTRVTYAGGGGGGGYNTSTGGVGGIGGGAVGGNNTTGATAASNTGGGGGGAGGTANGGAGGSGIVVLRYPDYYTAPTATTGSPTAATIGPASLNFGGASSLSVASNAAFAYGTGDFTWEAWIYPTAASWTTGNFYILDHGSNGGVLQYASNKLSYYNPTTGGGSSLYTTGAATITTMTWTHIAVARASGTTRLFINGNLLTSAADGHSYAAQAVTVGNYGGGGGFYFSGYMTNIRLIKGAAAYTASFTLPAQQLTAVTGTSLLLNANYWAPLTDSSSNGFSITASGSVPIFNSSPYNWVGSGAGYRVYTWTASGTVTF